MSEQYFTIADYAEAHDWQPPTLRPDFLIPTHSSIAGIGLTCTRLISQGEILGVSHIRNIDYADGYIRTFLGSLMNHSSEPNATYVHSPAFMGCKFVKALDDIYPGQEILIQYGQVKPLEA